jgi:LPXTG-motif cell wall-anchored protein
MKRFSLFGMGAMAIALVSMVPPTVSADEIDKKTVVTFDQPTEAPGIILPPGKYVIRLLNSSSNRHIAEIMNERLDHLYALTFTAAAERLDPGEKTILTFYEGTNGQPRALRRWFWPGEVTGQEFLYPKNQAAKIASNTSQKVAEGGIPTVAESGQSLTPDNAKGLVLESREETKPVASPLTASAAEPPPPAAAPVTVIAQNTPPPPVRDNAPRSNSSRAVSANSEVAQNAVPNNSTLPQTASNLPLIAAAGIVSLALALAMASVKRSRSL